MEFVATMVSLFKEHRVNVVPEREETDKEARARVLDVTKDFVNVLLLQMRHPEKVGLKWRKIK